MDSSDDVVEVLGLEVVPLPAAEQPDLGRHGDVRRRAVDALQHRRSSISRPGTAASTSTLASAARAVASAAGRSAQSSTRLIPIEEPPRAGLTKTGSPSRSRSVAASDRPARTTVYGPTGSPSASSSFLVNSLSIATALPSTPEPTYGTPAISSRPWIVPSSPYGPCRTGKTTSTPCEQPGARHRARPRRARRRSGRRAARPQCRSRPWAAPAVDPQRRRVARGDHPGALGGDADRHHLVRVGVEGREDAPRGDAGDGVLRAAAAEDDGDPHSPSGTCAAPYPGRLPRPLIGNVRVASAESGMTCARSAPSPRAAG